MREIFFVSGLPRSGSTLLMNLLAQHPLVHTTATSGCPQLLSGIKNIWHSILEHKADKTAGDPINLHRVLQSALYSYHNTDKPFVVDKSRSWGHHIELLEKITNKKIKILAPVRDICEIAASFEMLHRKGSHTYSRIGIDTDARVTNWCSPTGEIGSAYLSLKDIFQRHLGDRVCFIEYDTLTTNPQSTMNQIWNYLGLAQPEHNFTNILNKTPEDDRFYGYVDLHTIKNEVIQSKPKAYEILGSHVVEKLKNQEFWRMKV